MNKTNQRESLSQTANANLEECWWMQGGVVDYKLCDRDYDCEHCPFDEALHGRVTMPLSDSPASNAAGPIERNWEGRVRNTRKGSAYIQGCEVSGALFYHPAHTWARIEDGGCVRTGLDDFAQRILGRPYLITLPEPGATLRFGEGCWDFTHQAGVSVLVAPVSGRVKEINPALADRPALLNRDPYGEGWVLLIEPTDLKGCLKRLLYGPKVTQWYEREFEKLYEKVSELSNRSSLAGPTMNDGGWLNKDFMNALNADQLQTVIDYFFPLSPAEKAETNEAILVKHGGESW
jgi:glycine cleavage system H lipoate-binding protein